MHSCIFEGTVRHRRFHPVDNRFRYRLFMMYLDLGELSRVFDDHPLWSVGTLNVACFLRRDHMGPRDIPLDRAVRDYVERHTGERPTGPIRMLTHLRYYGYCFNPVSFYYCYDAPGHRVDTIVAEVHNTPWKEEHPYVLSAALNEHPIDAWRRYRFPKSFHVSPFMDMDNDYDWRFRVPGDRLSVHMIALHKGRRLFDASLQLRRREIHRANLTRALLAYPLMTTKVATMIHWQALRLVLKKAPFYVHPKKRLE
ncbi:MAG: DUF1365 domain-containing protein [Desulfobacteraceae bacterium]|nr:DUF1365 domain-containing protein [Desulfobacteraceae bacterium]